MRVVCLQEHLSKGLTAVSRAAVSRSVASPGALSVLSNVLLCTDRGQLKLSATNLEVGLSRWVRAAVEEEGAIAVPAKLLAGLVSSLPAERIELTATARDRSLHVRCAQHEANIKGIDAAEFPLMPDLADEPDIQLRPELLSEMIEQVTPAAASDESRPILTGTLIKLDEDAITMVASDGFRLSVRQARSPMPASQRQELILPAAALRELAHIAAESQDGIVMRVSRARNQVLFRTTHDDLLSQLVEGTFPDYTRLIPRMYVTRTVVDVQALREAVRLSLFFARDTANIVRLHIMPGEPTGRMEVSATSAQAGDNASELAADVDGVEEKISFNARYLMDALEVIRSTSVVLETSSPSSPAVIRPLGGDEFVHVIVPMIIY